MPIGVGAGAVIAGIAGAGAATTAGVINAHAAGSAADKQVAATDHAADLQAASAAAALDYEKQQSALAATNANLTAKGNYDMWAAREGRLSTLGQQFGLPARTIPAYVPLATDASPAGAAAPSAPAASAATPSNATAVQSYMLGLLKSGMAPSAVADKTNAQFGSAIGTGAKYYPGTNTIGLPDFYVAGPTQGDSGNVWNVVDRQASTGAAAAPLATLGTPLQAATAAAAVTAPPTPTAPAITGNLAMPVPRTLADYFAMGTA